MYCRNNHLRSNIIINRICLFVHEISIDSTEISMQQARFSNVDSGFEWYLTHMHASTHTHTHIYVIIYLNYISLILANQLRSIFCFTFFSRLSNIYILSFHKFDCSQLNVFSSEQY